MKKTGICEGGTDLVVIWLCDRVSFQPTFSNNVYPLLEISCNPHLDCLQT